MSRGQSGYLKQLNTKSLEQIYSAWSAERISKVFPDADVGGVNLEVVPTADERFGDYQCNAAMALSKRVRLPPREVASRLIAGAQPPQGVARMEIAGPGFINFHLEERFLSTYLASIQSDPRLGVPMVGQGRTMVMDYSSPNIAKPMHIGHIRSTVIGNAIDRLHRFLGYRVIADNHLGDWGTQFGILILGYRNFLDAQALAEDPIAELERLYVKSYERSKSDEAWLNQARAELVKLQQGDAENRALWRQFVQLSLGEFEKIYRRLGVQFDLHRGESYYNDRLASVVERLQALGLAEESEGALVVKLDEEKLPLCIVRKSDGGFNYTTTDLATVLSRAEEFNPDAVIYVTDERQQLHFKQFFAVARKMGVTTRLIHVWFGLMRLPEGTFSTRQGNVIKLERLLDEAEARALELVRQCSPQMDESTQRAVARAVGIGAVKYADLSQNPQSLVTFTWEKALALDGNSAPYLQYAHARISSVRDKYREQFGGRLPEEMPIVLTEPIERRLAVRLARFPDVAMRAAAFFKPNTLCEYLFDLAQTYSTFYQTVPFLKAEEGVRESRVRLCEVTARVIKQGLDLLGIEAPDRI